MDAARAPADHIGVRFGLHHRAGRKRIFPRNDHFLKRCLGLILFIQLEFQNPRLFVGIALSNRSSVPVSVSLA